MLFENVVNKEVISVYNKENIDKYMVDGNWKALNSYNFNLEDKINSYKQLDSICQIKYRLEKISEDIVQALCGEIVPKLEDKKEEFVLLHNELRVLEGKSKRDIISRVN